MHTILQTKNLCKYYGRGENQVKAVDNINLEIEQGEFAAIVGKSGSGKSTLLHLLGGLDTPTSGSVLVRGKDISIMKEEELAIFRRRKIGFIFQAFNLVSSINVWENIVLPLGLDDQPVNEAYIKELVQMLGLEDRLSHLPNALSGGQQQRAAIARALAARPAIILADEPTGSLDTLSGHDVMGLLKVMAEKYQQTLIVVTHDLDIAQMADRIVRLKDEKIWKGSDSYAGES